MYEFQYRMGYKCDFQKVGGDCGIFKQTFRNRTNEFLRICGSKGVAMKSYQKQLKAEQTIILDAPKM